MKSSNIECALSVSVTASGPCRIFLLSFLKTAMELQEKLELGGKRIWVFVFLSFCKNQMEP